MDLNGHAASAHKLVKVGDQLEITFPHGRRRFRVKGLAENHVPKAAARELYEETTPPPTPEQLEVRRLEKLLKPRDEGRPSKKDRRDRQRWGL